MIELKQAKLDLKKMKEMHLTLKEKMKKEHFKKQIIQDQYND